MNNLDVSMRLRLLYQSREAKAAEKDLKEIDAAAKKLGKSNGGDKLGRDLKEVSGAARAGKRAVGELEAEARKLNKVKTDTVEKELKALGKAARATAKDLDGMRQKLGQFDRVKARPMEKMVAPTRELDGVMGALGRSAGTAAGALLAFASVDNIVRGLEQLSSKFRDLNRDVASVAVTAEMRTPEAMKTISDSNEKLAIRYGQSQTEVNSARKSYAAAGIGLDSQETILDPTLKAAKAEDASGDTMAGAMIAGKQNLKLSDADVPAALDMMAKGAKLGSFEVKDMAKNFPELGAYMQGAGRTGLQGWAELVTMSQIARFSAGSPDEAANNLRNWLAKLSSKDTVKNFADKDVDLEKVKAKALKEGKSYPMAVMDEVMKLTKGNEFKVNELFGDQQAYLALKPLMENKPLYDQWLNEILNKSGGTVDADYNFLKNLPKEKADRRGAALEAAGSSIGSKWDAVTSPVKELFARFMSSEYRDQQHVEETSPDLKEVIQQKGDLQMRLNSLQMGNAPVAQRDIDNLKAQIKLLQEQEDALRENLSRYDAPAVEDGRDLGTSTGKIPVPSEKPIMRPLSDNLGSAADKAMDGYNKNLSMQTERSVSIVEDAVSAIKALLNFTASPTIVPKVSTPSAPSAPSGGGEKHSSIVNNNTGVRLSQNIRSNNPRQAARLAARESERAIQRAMANSFHDTGRRLT